MLSTRPAPVTKQLSMGRAMLAIELADGELPTEFRLFAAGWNETSKGSYLFDEEAALATMAAYAQWGVDLAIDLEHQMFDGTSADPTAKDARGWFRLELRKGELWAVDVRWTEDGAERLRQRRQRYVSPAFQFDKDKRVQAVLNVAITSMPATYEAPALVAASRTATDFRTLSTGPAFADVTAAIGKALAERYPPQDEMSGPYPYVVDVFDATVVFDVSGKLYELAYTFDGKTAALGTTPVEVKRTYSPAAQAVATNRRATQKLAVAGEKMDQKLITAALDALIAGDTEACAKILKDLVVGAAGGETPAAEPAADGAAADELAVETPAADGEEEKKVMAAAASRLAKLTGKPSIVGALDEVETWHKSHVELSAERAKLAKDKEALDLAKRKENAATLVRLRAETPHTSGLATGTLAKRLLDEPLEEQTARVAALLAAHGGKLPAAPVTPGGGGGRSGDGSQSFTLADGTVQVLSARELAMCVEMKVEPKDYAARAALKKKAS